MLHAIMPGSMRRTHVPVHTPVRVMSICFHKISNIQNTLRNIIVSVGEINAYFTIDKNELPANMRFDMNLKIEAIQIPEEAKIKNFYLYWTGKSLP